MYSRCAMTIAISIRCDGFVDQNSPNDTRHNSVTRHTAECVPLPGCRDQLGDWRDSHCRPTVEESNRSQ